MENKEARTLKLFCPSISCKMVEEIPVAVGEDQRIDFGLISRIFGLDPDTVKLNRHFISRGFDLLSSSLTWKSLLSYFASRGLPTGHNDALIVHGKLFKSGTKRGHNPWCRSVNDDILVRSCGGAEVTSDSKKRKMKSNSMAENHQRSMFSRFRFKRKATVEDVDVLKKRRIVGSNNSGTLS